jgi:hypothetical protein
MTILTFLVVEGLKKSTSMPSSICRPAPQESHPDTKMCPFLDSTVEAWYLRGTAAAAY